ncbi:molybdenum cofactor sulfurase [Chanos chanos]|uniref:Molybdenum cofactor sulfurase n=1 Tax=Chanos chanos TaxID=29144 RepID=A0A6J2V8R5_CHACN|nr:molybdenum cofactor sulfurase [Chanos chanos]
MEAQSLEFKRLLRFESFREAWCHYGYGTDQQELIQKEFHRIKGITYLDHAGTTLFPDSQIKEFYQDISRNVYGNPHSHNPSSRLTHDTVEHVRYRILEHFNTSPEEYSVIFTSGCTAALKLLADSFPWRTGSDGEPGSLLTYLTDNHTSVVGIRGVTAPLGVITLPVTPKDVESRAKNHPQNDAEAKKSEPTPHIFCYPAQSNFSGRKYPLSYVRGIQSRCLYPACDYEGRWLVLLDAASFVGCSPLDLREHPADFVPISFYKIFGFPTGLGALLVRNEVADMLRKGYFGGGTAAAYLAGENYFVPRSSVISRFEDGTVSFFDIISLHHAFDTLHRLTGSMVKIQNHTFGLAHYTYIVLSSLRHNNGEPVAQIYCDTEFQDPSTQGAILNFNLLDSHGNIIGYSQVDNLASLFNIHVRTGCFCNTGACQMFLGISNDQAKKNLQAGHVCGDNIDLIDGRPTGSVRISFGYMSTFEDCQEFLNFVVKCFVDKPLRLDQERLARLKVPVPLKDSSPCQPTAMPNAPLVHQEREQNSSPAPITGAYTEGTVSKPDQKAGEAYTLTNLFIYPIKSCAAFEVTEWPLGPRGLLYDREWMLVNENGVCLSQKREPRLCLIQPSICLATKVLSIHAPGMDTISIPLEMGEEKTVSTMACQSKVCGDRVQTVNCGEKISAWLSEFLGKPCRLIRQNPDFTRDMKMGSGQGNSPSALSLANEAQYLMINKTSVSLLQDQISKRQDESNGVKPFDIQELIHRFRANLVISGITPFEEDDWLDLTVGSTEFKVVGKCGRCQMIGIDQSTGTRTLEPLRSLSEFRNGKLTFGVYLAHKSLKNSSVLSAGSLIRSSMLK